MKQRSAMIRTTSVVCLALGLAACELPPVDSTQWGYRGTAMARIDNPDTQAKLAAENEVPEAPPSIPKVGVTAAESYENVQVLGHLDVAEFTQLMTAITQWVSPEQGCTYCHSEDGNLADDSKYTKVVSRRMMQMTYEINGDWYQHVGDTGVTCYTCHRGQNVPSNLWFEAPPPRSAANAGWRNGQNGADNETVAFSSLPYDPFTEYFLNDAEIRVAAANALPTGEGASLHKTEKTYGLMMHMSDSLGVNCTFCHNSRAFRNWEQSTPQRVTAWHGIQMVRSLNNEYLDPLQPVYPDMRLGALGDAPKANCATCHQGLNKPLGGVSMLSDYPYLKK